MEVEKIRPGFRARFISGSSLPRANRVPQDKGYCNDAAVRPIPIRNRFECVKALYPNLNCGTRARLRNVFDRVQTDAEQSSAPLFAKRRPSRRRCQN